MAQIFTPMSYDQEKVKIISEYAQTATLGPVKVEKHAFFASKFAFFKIHFWSIHDYYSVINLSIYLRFRSHEYLDIYLCCSP